MVQSPGGVVDEKKAYRALVPAVNHPYNAGMKKPAEPIKIETVKDHYVWEKVALRCGDTQCLTCKWRASMGDNCLKFSRPLRRDKSGNVLRCQACLKADVKGGGR